MLADLTHVVKKNAMHLWELFHKMNFQDFWAISKRAQLEQTLQKLQKLVSCYDLSTYFLK